MENRLNPQDLEFVVSSRENILNVSSLPISCQIKAVSSDDVWTSLVSAKNISCPDYQIERQGCKLSFTDMHFYWDHNEDDMINVNFGLGGEPFKRTPDSCIWLRGWNYGGGLFEDTHLPRLSGKLKIKDLSGGLEEECEIMSKEINRNSATENDGFGFVENLKKVVVEQKAKHDKYVYLMLAHAIAEETSKRYIPLLVEWADRQQDCSRRKNGFI
jgi:hypothetical protein